jgi:hypothetical protein
VSLDSLRPFYRKTLFEGKIQRAVQASTTGGVARVFQLLEEPISANGIAYLLKQRHDDFSRPKSYVRVMGRSASCHDRKTICCPS